MMKPSVSTKGLGKEILNVVKEDKWQSASLIAAQLVFPPDALARRSSCRVNRCSEKGSKSALVSNRLRGLFLRGVIERRKSLTAGRYEYRLAPKPDGHESPRVKVVESTA